VEPSKPEQAPRSGSFWLADAPENVLRGRLVLDGEDSPSLDLDGSLTPWLQERSRSTQPDGSPLRILVPSADGPEFESLVVHGELDTSEPVTLVDAFTVARSGSPLPFGPTSVQRLRASYVLRGGHVWGRNQAYTRLRVRLRHLDAWAQLPSFAVAAAPPNGQSLTYLPSALAAVSLPDGALLDLDEQIELSLDELSGGRLHRQLWLRLRELPPATFRVLDRTLITPMSSLLTLAVGSDCSPVAIEVATDAAGPWLSIHHSQFVAESATRCPAHRMLAPRTVLGLEGVAGWLAQVDRLGPLPPVVADLVAGTRHTLETQLLELATVAEGLHRRLFAGERRLTDQQETAALLAVQQAVAGLDEKSAAAVRSAVEHLAEPSYPMRLQQLAGLAESIAPGCTGTTNRWKRKVADTRIEFAHRISGSFLNEGSIDELLAVLLSLRWLLTVVLLQQTGVGSEILAQRLRSHHAYQLFLQQVARWLPKVYGKAG